VLEIDGRRWMQNLFEYNIPDVDQLLQYYPVLLAVLIFL
jgi:hypothetical protein